MTVSMTVSNGTKGARALQGKAFNALFMIEWE